MIEIH